MPPGPLRTRNPDDFASLLRTRMRIISADLADVTPLNGKLFGLVGLDSAPSRTPTCSIINLVVNLWKLRFRRTCAFVHEARSSRSRRSTRRTPLPLDSYMRIVRRLWNLIGVRAFLQNSRCGSREIAHDLVPRRGLPG